MNSIASIVILLILLMLIDIPIVCYLYQTTYAGMFARINKVSNVSRLYTVGFIVYLLMAIGIYTFVISTTGTFFETLSKGALLGVILFGVYDLTNMATIPAFGLKEAAIDTLWGGLLFASVTALFICVNVIL